jgi:hypothetical protein
MEAMRNRVVSEVRSVGGVTRVAIVGTIDEDADLTPLARLSGRVELDLAGVRRLNSIGIREWMGAMRELGGRAAITLIRCSRAVVEQLNLIHGFIADSTVASFYAPMRCEPCDQDLDHLFDRAEVERLGGLPPVPCPSCPRPMELDELEQSYLLFVRETDGAS